MNPKITTEVSREITEQCVTDLTRRLNEIVVEINSIAKTVPEHRHSVNIRFVEIVIQFRQDRGLIRVGYRFFASLRAQNYTKQHLDERDRYIFSSFYLTGVDSEGEVCTFETGVLKWLKLGCHHVYKDLLAEYAHSLGVLSNPLTGEVVSVGVA